jgi:putative acetyltransferase
MDTGPGLITSPDPGPPPEPAPPHPIRIRLEKPGDEPGVRNVHERAFPGPEESAIVDEMRQTSPVGWQSILAVDELDRIVGHVLLSPCTVEGEDGEPLGVVFAIGPIAVLPDLQCRSIGSELMQAAAVIAVARGAPALVLLGHPEYYWRFGFVPARGLGLLPPVDAWPDAAWMGRLLPAWSDELRGTVRYPAAFGALA